MMINFNAALCAVQQGNSEDVKRYMRYNEESPHLRFSVCQSLIQTAVEHGQLKILRFLIKQGALLGAGSLLEKGSEPGVSKPRQLAIAKETWGHEFKAISSYLFAQEVFVYIDSLSLYQQHLLKNNDKQIKEYFQSAIDGDHKRLFGRLLKMGCIPETSLLDEAQEKVARFLAYCPGRRFQTIQDCIEGGEASPQLFTNLIEDEENTSDEESSDDEMYEFILWNRRALENTKGGEFLCRGVHYSPNYFNSTERKDSLTVAKQSETVYSLATTGLSIHPWSSFCNENADQQIKEYFVWLKSTPDKTEEDKEGKSVSRTINGQGAQFGSFYHHFVQVYVNNYADLFCENGGMVRIFEFYGNRNPFISTSKNIKTAVKFGSGYSVNELSRYFPRVRKSTGEYKHRTLGYLQVYSIDDQYKREHAADTTALVRANQIGIGHLYRHAEEVAIESSIPGRFILGFIPISLPDLHSDWDFSIEENYGLKKRKYTKLKADLLNSRNTQQVNEILKKLIKSQIEFMASRIEGLVNQAIQNAINEIRLEKTMANLAIGMF